MAVGMRAMVVSVGLRALMPMPMPMPMLMLMLMLMPLLMISAVVTRHLTRRVMRRFVLMHVYITRGLRRGGVRAIMFHSRVDPSMAGQCSMLLLRPALGLYPAPNTPNSPRGTD
jgi:hypothetical protein